MIISELFEELQQCPECGGISFSDLLLAEKKDACYHKVKASAKVWPSAYASGRLVQCRKKGAANYGNSKNESMAEGEVVPFKRPHPQTSVSWQNLPKDVLYLANDWFWADYEGSGLDATMDPKGLGSGFANQQKYLGAQLQQRGWAIDIDDEFENVVLKNKQGQTIFLPIEDAQTFSGWAKGTNPVTEQGVAESYYDRDDYYSARMGGEYGKGMTSPDYGTDSNTGPGRGDIHKGQTKHLSVDPFGRSLGHVPHGARGRIYSTDEVDETRRGQIPMTLKPGETDNLEPEDFVGFKKLPAYQQGQAAQQKAGKQLIHKSPYTYQSDQDFAYSKGAFDARQAATSAEFAKLRSLATAEGEQRPGADYRDPREVNYDGEYDAMVARVKRLAGLGPLKTVYDPNKRVYRNMPTAVQPKK